MTVFEHLKSTFRKGKKDHSEIDISPSFLLWSIAYLSDIPITNFVAFDICVFQNSEAGISHRSRFSYATLLFIPFYGS